MQLPFSSSFFGWDLLSSLGTLIALVAVLPSFAIFNLLTVVSFVRGCSSWLGADILTQGSSCRKFLGLSQPLKRLESETRAPIQSTLSESLAGLTTLRAYGDTGRALVVMLDLAADHCRPASALAHCNTWISARIGLECVTATCVGLTRTFADALSRHLSAIVTRWSS